MHTIEKEKKRGMGSKGKKSSRAHVPKNDKQPVGVPILLVFRRGKAGHLGQGVDLIMPEGCGGDRLFAYLCRCGCRPIGVWDRWKLSNEMELPEFPFDFPETSSGQMMAIEEGLKTMRRHMMRPPSKRVNYGMIGTPCPFLPSWNMTDRLQNATVPTNDLIIRALRANESPYPKYPPLTGIIKCITDALNAGGKLDARVKHAHAVIRAIEHACPWDTIREMKTPIEYDDTNPPAIIIPVKIVPCTRGVPYPPSMICVPTLEDIGAFMKGTEHYETEEPIHPQYKTRNKPSQYSALKLAGGEQTSTEGNWDIPNWINGREISPLTPPVPMRNIGGFVTSGRHSLSTGHGYGYGAITLSSYLNVYVNNMMSALKYGKKKQRTKNNSQSQLVLFKEPSSRVYRFAFITACIGISQ
eukprot:GHVO01064193.1.p1 GENE.GHVO01064193.1~~GHVO01064193.1.p1  ORF type:complete len:477 (+),score=78.65 GHVO01064193.1:198-1433(+)